MLKRKHISMKIKFDALSSDPTDPLIVVYCVSPLALLFSCYILGSESILADAHRTLSQSMMLNWTSSPMRRCHGISYDDLRCSVQLAKNISLQNCLLIAFS